MHYKLLGSTGLRVSELCLGAMTFGEDWGWGASKAESQKLLQTYMDHGGNFIDTANYYTKGSSESILGEITKDVRERLVIATKYTLNTDPQNNANAGGNHRKNMVRAVEQSLKRLQTDYIDLYWVHIWDLLTPVDEIMRGLDDLVRAGKIVYTGFSDAPAWLVAKGNTMASFRGWNKFAALQLEYNLLERGIERELLPMARHDGLSILAWSPLASGVLSGKYRSITDNGKTSRGALVDSRLTERNLRIVEVLTGIAREMAASPAAVALRWLQYQYHQIIPIIGARTIEQLKDNLTAVGYELDPSQLQRLDEASRIDPGFPYDLLKDQSPGHGSIYEKINGKYKNDMIAEMQRRRGISDQWK